MYKSYNIKQYHLQKTLCGKQFSFSLYVRFNFNYMMRVTIYIEINEILCASYGYNIKIHHT